VTRAPIELRADCGRCVGLCCVALPFTRSAEFAIDKPAGRPRPNLRPDHRCTIHAQLSDRGFPGCVAFDCFGAGQRVAREFAHDSRATMFAAFTAGRQVHEVLWHLEEARAIAPSETLRRRARELAAGGEACDLRTVDVAALRAGVGELLAEISAALRAGLTGRDYRRADLAGADLRRTDLRGADLRGALLVGAGLSGVDLDRADLLGADVRGAELSGADLRTAMFVTQPQLDAAIGTAQTGLPGRLRAPDHWR
jgi:Pentapeptide repeats (8 copies)